MNHVASMNVFEQDSSFLRFGTWSLVLHVLFFVFVSFVHFSLQVEKPPPTVKVTFVEVPAPPPPPEPEPQAPAMRQAQRLQPQPIQRKQIQPTPQPPDISQPVEMPKVVAQPPPQQPPPQPLKRRVLQDNRATDTLQARNLTKTASRKTTTKTTTKVAEPPSMFVPGFSTVAALQGAANRRHVVRSSLPPTTPGRGRRTLQASASGEAQSTTSVGVLRSVHPIYPRIAKKSGWEGTVLVRVTVEANGRASQVVVSRSSGRKVLDDAAVKAVRRWSFRPARDGNIPIRSVVVIPLKFSLSKQS